DAAVVDSPLIRVRVSTEDFQHSDAVSVTSYGPGSVSPTAAGRDYDIIFNEQLATDRFRLDFDVLNFSDTEASAIVQLALETAGLDLYAIDESSLGTATTVQTYDFSNSNMNGFTARNASPIIAVPAQMSATPTGLLTRGFAPGPGTPSDVIFGFWGMESNVPILADRLYRVDAVVATDAAEGSVADIPAFRLRINDTSLMYSRILNVDSTGDAGLEPPTGGSRLYSIWFIPEPEIVGEDFIFSFDYLFVKDAGQAATIGTTLKSLTVKSYGL
ncbi:MAG: hypothetical protein ABI579_09505, partial [Candidatus Sumerlaeota bacterium]